MADPWTDAWQEAEASAPPGVLIYATLELQHPAFVDDVDGPFSVRAVASSAEDVDLRIEDGALLNSGELVTFTAIPFTADHPSYEQGKTPEFNIVVDGVARELQPYLEDAVKLRADMTMIYREYRSDDIDAPCFGPVQFTVRKVKVSGAKVEGTAFLDDLANRKFPNKVYDVFSFPTLRS